MNTSPLQAPVGRWRSASALKKKKGGGSRWFSDVKKQLEGADMGEGLLDLSQLPQIPELHTLVAGGGLSCITIPAKPRSPILEANSPSKTLALPRFQDLGDHAWSQQGVRRPASARTTKARSGADMRARPVSAKSRFP